MAEKEIVLDVRNLKQYFHNGVGKNKVVVKAVDDVSFKIARGQTFGLVGESAAARRLPVVPLSAYTSRRAARFTSTGS